ncbi:helix-turn-helix transcriptional regulator [Streptomyces cocklensis]|uniref:Helix-turn-helix domain-containing protein n=1 Tax=Actinacidiphila cocklensis TaxID=887465 RepID=A0A9W4GS91_9ACTN|nr:helix-turn-helix transcriptional regulator [Actinacidiphila cocklensis]MDD1059014.1 helix-turn-helix transcriptional regulator [Actinacidiphila cocklensis]WSX73465.1 helix-turn-helix transcriptional regulator [Streptomyces sp. NBC_00899]WSX80470.1 helix-turn-helix transcriptional regulator [Streptomyces sp. NBC_00899]CAG6394518.1 Helix-turn-helix domain-containing protein [Actinacidiphila cocklensis]
MDRPELADFLRRSRDRLNPADVGLGGGARRRTPGLRREEVAQLAGMSVDYYTRLEQARGPRPSRQMLGALARALRLTSDERDHVFHLAGEEPPRETGGSGHVRPGLLLVLDRLHDTPAQVVSDIGDILVQNTMASALLGDVSARPPEMRNSVRRAFTEPSAMDIFPPEDHETLLRTHVAHLRAVLAARPDDPRAASLVAELRARSEPFERLWSEHKVAVRRSDTKRFRHPVVGDMELDCEVLLSTWHDQRLIVYTARPGTEAYERLQLLRVVGLQDLTVG